MLENELEGNDPCINEFEPDTPVVSVVTIGVVGVNGLNNGLIGLIENKQ